MTLAEELALLMLIERARGYPITADEIERQRVSFISEQTGYFKEKVQK